MSRITNKADLYHYISIAKNKYGITDSSYPLNIIERCEQRDDVSVELIDIKRKGLCGIAFIGNKMNTIILNSNRNLIERNYDCAHEVIHLIKHRDLGRGDFKCFDDYRDTGDDNIEWQANEGAAELLVPYGRLLPFLMENRDQLESGGKIWRVKSQLADMFNVSETVIKIRFENLKYEIYQHLNGCPLDQIEILSREKQKQRGISVKSLNDIEEEDYINSIIPDEYVTYEERELLDRLKFGE